MRLDDLIAELEIQRSEHGNIGVGIIMDGRQDLASDDITAVWTLVVSDRAASVVIDCRSMKDLAVLRGAEALLQQGTGH